MAIELYQEAVEKEQMQEDVVGREGKEGEGRVSQEERILERIKKYIKESHELREERRMRKIGISTSLDTVRSTLGDMVRFLVSKTRVKGQ